jgi:hypothetical protein
MTAEATRAIAGALAERFGVEPEHIEATLTENPLAAALALTMMQPAAQVAPDERTEAAALVRFVASLVGACPVCLGENPGCLDCGGSGAPGSRAPNETALVAWISPPLRRLGLCVGRPRRAAHDYNHGGGYG